MKKKAEGIVLTPEELREAYASRYVLDSSLEKKLGVQIPFDVYLQDPLVAKDDPLFGFETVDNVQWEPGLADGPTSARFVVVDYNGDTDAIVPPAKWDAKTFQYTKDGKPLDRDNSDPLQFHQLNVWVAIQRALAFYQEGFGMGRTIPWGFEGNRLIVVPHAGYCENAFYDRTSKSLQFYYFGPEDKRVYTCLSADIINHECAHAILDGIRPHFLESSSVQTAAFHEFVGDFTAVLILLRNNEFRKKLAATTGGELSEARQLSYLAEQFGRVVNDRPYLRNAAVKTKMSEVVDDDRPHYVSQVLTGAMYEILVALSRHYRKERNETAYQAFWNAIHRMQPTALQPLDLLPPVEVTFKDYALAVLRHEEITNPKDPYGYYQNMLKIFVDREILREEDVKVLNKPRYLMERLDLNIFYDVGTIMRSKSAAYYFLNDNRAALFIPTNQDFLVSDLYTTAKLDREGQRLPKELVLEYIWEEPVELDGPQYGELNGKTTCLLCGGTLVFDERGAIISWFRKPGTQLKAGKKNDKENAEGLARREELLVRVAKMVRSGQVGIEQGGDRGLLGTRIPPVTMKTINGMVRLEMQLGLNLVQGGEKKNTLDAGGRKWQISF